MRSILMRSINILIMQIGMTVMTVVVTVLSSYMEKKQYIGRGYKKVTVMTVMTVFYGLQRDLK